MAQITDQVAIRFCDGTIRKLVKKSLELKVEVDAMNAFYTQHLMTGGLPDADTVETKSLPTVTGAEIKTAISKLSAIFGTGFNWDTAFNVDGLNKMLKTPIEIS